jgi:hypothetical protein
MVDREPHLFSAGQLMSACAVLSILCMFTNLQLLKSSVDWTSAASVVFGFLLMLAASGTGGWLALKALRVTAQGSTGRKLATAGLIVNALPVLIVTLVWVSISRVADDPQRPSAHSEVRTRKAKSEKPRRPGREPLINDDGLISAFRVRQEIAKLEQALYEEAPSTLAAVGRVYRQSYHLAGELRGMQKMSEIHPDSVDPQAVPYLERAEAAVSEFRDHVTKSLIVWTDASSLPSLRSRWEPVRDRYFTHESWMRQGSSELDLAQSVRKPDIDSDLMYELGLLQELVFDLEGRTEFDEQWAAHVSDVITSTRVWSHRKDVAESMRSRELKGWKRSVSLGPDGPGKLMDVYSRMRSVCESFFYYLPTPHWMTEKHQTRLAKSSRRLLDDAWQDLLALQQ